MPLCRRKSWVEKVLISVAAIAVAIISRSPHRHRTHHACRRRTQIASRPTSVSPDAITFSPPRISLAIASSSSRSHCRSADSRSARIQVCGKRAMSCASAIACARVSPFGTSRLARPMRNASAPPTGRPVRIRSMAWEWPISRGRRMVPRSISGTPKRRQKMPKVASSATTRMSAQSASSMPPATAKPSTAAITGFVNRSRLGPIGAIESWPPISRFLLGSPAATALRSAPAQK